MTTAVLVAADATSEGQPAQPYLSPDDLASITPLWQEAVGKDLMPLVAGVWDDSAGQIHAEMLDATGVDFPFPAVGSAAAEAYLAQARNVYDNIGNELWETARAQMLEGFQAGESIDQIAERLRSAAGMTARTAILVARSTVVEASNAGSIQTARAAGLDMRKEWIATPDARTRPTHRAADGQKVDLADKFVVGGFEADVPGDSSLPPQEKYRCRCTIGYVMTDAVAKAAQRDAIPEAPLPGTSGGVGAPPAVEAPAPEARAARRAAARARQKVIDSAEPVADFAAEVDQVAYLRRNDPFDDDLAKILRQRIRSAEAAGVPVEDLAAMRAAVEARDILRVRAEARRLAEARALSPVEVAGQQVPFDPARHQALVEGTDIADGQLVVVDRQGHVLQIGDETLQLDRAKVRVVEGQPAPTLNTPRTVSPVAALRVSAEDRLRAGAASGVRQTEPLTGGSVGQVDLVTFNDGSRAIRKTAHRDYVGHTPLELTDREELAALLGRAIGAPVPAVIRTGANEVLMGYVPDARTGWMAMGRTKAIRAANQPKYVDSDDGRLLGLLDILADNRDRHGGNWLVRKEDGRIVGIDHGLTWVEGQMQYLANPPNNSSIFAKTYAKSGWLPNQLSQSDIQWLGRQLESLRPRFAERGRENWLNFSVARLHQIGEHAVGTTPRLVTDLAKLAEDRLTTTQRIAALNERLAVLQDLLDSGETQDPDSGDDLQQVISDTKSALALLRKPTRKGGRK